MDEEVDEKVNQAMTVLGMIAEDTSVPRNIRRAANEATDALQDSKIESMAVRASNAISTLAEVSQDPIR